MSAVVKVTDESDRNLDDIGMRPPEAAFAGLPDAFDLPGVP